MRTHDFLLGTVHEARARFAVEESLALATQADHAPRANTHGEVIKLITSFRKRRCGRSNSFHLVGWLGDNRQISPSPPPKCELLNSCQQLGLEVDE